MRRSTLFTLVAGAAVAVFGYTPQAAAWLTLGRDQGYIPEQVPAEVTDPPVLAAGIITVVAALAVMLIRFVWSRMGASGFEAAIGGEAVRQQIENEGRKFGLPQLGAPYPLFSGVEQTTQHGREIIGKRKRLAGNREEIKVAEDAEDELRKEAKANSIDLEAAANLLSGAEMSYKRASDEHIRRQRDVEIALAQQREARNRKAEIDRQLSALSAAKQQLLLEQRELV